MPLRAVQVDDVASTVVSHEVRNAFPTLYGRAVTWDADETRVE